jgi:hypothetical protein
MNANLDAEDQTKAKDIWDCQYDTSDVEEDNDTEEATTSEEEGSDDGSYYDDESDEEETKADGEVDPMEKIMNEKQHKSAKEIAMEATYSDIEKKIIKQ